MKINYILFSSIILICSCKKVLDKTPLATQTEESLYSDSSQAILGVNAIYDAASWDETNGIGANLEWMFGDLLSNDAEKGSTLNDFSALTALKNWSSDPGNNPARDAYADMYQTIYRANVAIQNLNNASWNSDLKTRLIGEARFLRGYAYFYLLRLFGGVPLVTSPLSVSEMNVQRSTFAQTAALIESDLKFADSTLPLKSQYASSDIGRATKGAAEGYLARVIMYQLGTVNGSGHTWQDVYNYTSSIISSNEYSLYDNYAALTQEVSENGSESLFEIQFSESNATWGAVKVGTENNVYQNNRNTWGWGFNNPTTNLKSEFETNDPRLACTMYGSGDTIVGIRQIIDYPNANFTGYLNAKAAIIQPAQVKESGQNIRKIRYADILLMQAEADAHLGNNADAISKINSVRARARKSTRPMGTLIGAASAFQANIIPSNTLPDISSSLSGDALLSAIWHERRVEFGMEALHFWDLIRTGNYLSTLSGSVLTNCNTHLLQDATINPVPVLPIPLTEVQAYNLTQNPGY
ncbi:RagB/SusD family nutrient uptake outer membrane protein [Rhizosphaericola mali]|uniref:RagB/SusD family nutrient uptake outer membrane protein n=1 Tax=Rhizosphaericola mali TaxID=2545455 RepID=A0A5P2GE06_9BACT|nr:RagB/SusD family nutrient uptake outer membrane protein [Rhizosphaericola mali]QES89841.1 RagB/SusD family nutrient uptake outer membrane protein [Rhizosphaericola mali]